MMFLAYRTTYQPTELEEKLTIDLKSISKNIVKPPRIVLYGPPGIGKTTFASGAPDPIFILTEDGLGDLEVEHFPLCSTFDEVLGQLESLGREDHEYKTIVIDSLDALEPMIWTATCKRLGVTSIEAPGYGKGYVEAQTEWRLLFSYLTALRDDKNLTILMIAHGAFTRIEDPEHPVYDTNTLKLNKRASALTTEYCDIVAFASHKMFTKVDDVNAKEKRVRAIPTTERVIKLSASPAYTAKNRYHMPEVLPLSWEEFAKHLPKGGK